jgi:hypothetical protein
MTFWYRSPDEGRFVGCSGSLADRQLRARRSPTTAPWRVQHEMRQFLSVPDREPVGPVVAIGLCNANHGANNRRNIMTTPKIPRVSVALNPSTHVPDLITQAKAVVSALTGNVYFPSPTPSLATMSTHIAELELAETVAQTKAKGAAAARDVKLRALQDDLHAIKSYIQQIANANPGNAEAIVTSTTLTLRKATPRIKQDLAAKHGAVSGSVRLVAKSAGHRASYQWQWSLDQKVWTDLPVTIQARTTVLNLTPAVMHYFRYHPVTKTGPGDWSQVVSLLVT